MGVKLPVIITWLKVFVPDPVMVVVPLKVTEHSKVSVPVIDRFPVSTASAPGFATKVACEETVNVPPILNGELFAVNDPVVGETRSAPKAINPLLEIHVPLAVNVPLAEKGELAVSLLPALMVILLKVAEPLPVFENIECRPPKVVVLFPTLRIPVPDNVRSPVIVYAALGVNTPVSRMSLNVFDPVPVIVVIPKKVVAATVL